MLMELFRDTFRLKGILPDQKRLEQLQCASHQMIAGKDAADTDQSFIRVDRHQRMNTIIRLKLVAPTALRRRAAQPSAPNRSNLHLVSVAHSSATGSRVCQPKPQFQAAHFFAPSECPLG
jgi:hypothetical protein